MRKFIISALAATSLLAAASAANAESYIMKCGWHYSYDLGWFHKRVRIPL
jgi:hypothetical protein